MVCAVCRGSQKLAVRCLIAEIVERQNSAAKLVSVDVFDSFLQLPAEWVCNVDQRLDPSLSAWRPCSCAVDRCLLALGRPLESLSSSFAIDHSQCLISGP